MRSVPGRCRPFFIYIELSQVGAEFVPGCCISHYSCCSRLQLSVDYLIYFKFTRVLLFDVFNKCLIQLKQEIGS